MKTSVRFDNAIKKLYEAFHSDSLNPLCCKQCAVGNILDNRDFWKHFAVAHGCSQLSYVGQVNEAFGKRFAGFTPSELLRIEEVFLAACGVILPVKSSNYTQSITKDDLFQGLSATVALLCEFENIPNRMDYSDLFDFRPQPQSEEVLQE